MALSRGTRPVFDGLQVNSITLSPNSAQGTGNSVPAHVTAVRLAANVNDVNDFTVLPSLAHVPTGHTVTIVAGAANSEVRTPAASGEKINNVDCDGPQEYLMTATQIVNFVKIDNTIGWMGQGFTAIGAVAAAVVPD
jgi:hypothetical protein